MHDTVQAIQGSYLTAFCSRQPCAFQPSSFEHVLLLIRCPHDFSPLSAASLLCSAMDCLQARDIQQQGYRGEILQPPLRVVWLPLVSELPRRDRHGVSRHQRPYFRCVPEGRSAASVHPLRAQRKGLQRLLVSPVPAVLTNGC